MLKFELIKIYREKTIYILFTILLLVLCVPLFLGNAQFDYLKYYENSYAANITTIKNIQDDPTAAETVEDIKEVNGHLKKLIDSIKKEDNKSIVKNELDFEKKNLEDMEAGKLHSGPLIDQRITVAILEYLKNNDLDKKNSDPKKLEGIQYLNLIVSTPQLMLFILILICLHVAYVFNLDYRKNNFILYCIAPRSYLSTYFIKLLANILSVFTNVIGSFLIILAILSLKNGIGRSNYPIAIIQNNTDVKLMSTGEFIIKTLLFLFLLVIFIHLFGLLLSILSDNFILNISVLIFPFIFAQYEVIDMLISDKFKHFFLLSYIDITHILAGGSSMKTLASSLLTYENGMIVLIISIIAFLLISIGILLISSKKLMIRKLAK
jgi:ABC-2 type transport system permease protein